jgi:tRNA/rRNA methyltransferase
MILNVVLVGTLYSRNLGSCSRVMANMGGGRLITIDAKCEYNLEARQGAAGAQTHLVTRTTYDNWQDFFAEEKDGIRIAFSALEKPDTDEKGLEQRAREVIKHLNTNTNGKIETPIYLIFGAEDNGLSQVDVEYANFICQLPTHGNYPSLNLSHAVLLALYIFHNEAQTILKAKTDIPQIENKKDAAALEISTIEERFQFPEQALKEWLTILGFDIENRKRDVYKTLKRILLSNLTTARELLVFEAIVFQTVRKLKNNRKKNSD